MRTIGAAFERLARSFDAGVATRVRVVNKTTGVTVDLSDHDGVNWVRGIDYAEDLDNTTATFTVALVAAVGENTINPLRSSRANRSGAVLALKRLVIVDVQVLPPEGVADPSNWIELVRGQVDRIRVSDDAITLECRDESGRIIDRWQEQERNWPATVPDSLEDTLQAVLDTAAFDPGPWVGDVARVIGDLRRPTEPNGYLYRCTTAGTTDSAEPSWNATPGGTTTDGSATWTNVGALPAAEWTTATVVQVGRLVRPTARNGYLYRCTVAGTTGGAEPTWPTTYLATVTDNTATWQCFEDSFDLSTPVSPGWNVTRAEASDYGSPPQSYWDLCRTFVDQIGWDLRFKWTGSRRQPVLRSIDKDDGSTYTQNGDAGAFTADQYVLDGDVEFESEHVRNIVEVWYFDGPETGPRTQTRIRVEDADSIAEFGPLFCQYTLDQTSLINSSAEALTLAGLTLGALSKPAVSLSVRVPFFPWVEVGDGLTLQPRPEGALFDATSGAGTFIALVQGVSHRTEGGEGSTQLALRGFFVSDAEVAENLPVRPRKVMAREARARRGITPTKKRPRDVLAHLYDAAGASITGSTGKPGTQVPVATVHRDTNGNTSGSFFIAPVSGLYAFTACVAVPNSLTPGLELELRVVADGANVGGAKVTIGTGGKGSPLTASGTAYMTETSSLAMYLSTDPATNITPDTGIGKTYLHVRLIR